ncbi:MAG TPA: pyridoxamine 5'-phosphate oxidase family protein [Candidatus Saccharimonadales bacterium]|nr:pyridoxamine 5'-phosphate oxidase family protein [Candidatus Saccharimonadales bacterium]
MRVNVETIVREYIDKSLHMSLATASNGKPWVCEVHFVYDDNLDLYFRSLTSRRHSQEIAANPNVAGNIVRQHAVDEYPHAIYFEGTAGLLEGGGEHERVFELFRNRLNVPESILADAQKDDGHKFYQITVENWYAFGKFGGHKGLKHKLEWNGGKR